MAKLLLFRHGEAPRIGNEPDKKRQLSRKGKLEISQVVGFIKHKYIPECILSSDAVRTRQTTLKFCEYMQYKPVINFFSALYNCSPIDIIDTVIACGDNFMNLMVVGHNPSITRIVDELHTYTDKRELDIMARNYEPTAKLVVLSGQLTSWPQIFETRWKIEEVFWPQP